MIGMVKTRQEEYGEAIEFHQKSLEIYQKTLPKNHSDFAASYNNIGGLYRDMGEYSEALAYYEYALDILSSSLPPSHPDIENVRQTIEIVNKFLLLVRR